MSSGRILGILILIFVMANIAHASQIGEIAGHMAVMERFEELGLMDGADDTMMRVRNPSGYEMAELLQILMLNLARTPPAIMIEKVKPEDIREIRHLVDFYSDELAFNMMMPEDTLEDYLQRLDEYAFLLAEGGSDIRADHLPRLYEPTRKPEVKIKPRIYSADRLIDLPGSGTLRKNGIAAQAQYMSLRTRVNNVEADGTQTGLGLRYGLTRNLEVGVQDHRFTLELGGKTVHDYVREANIRYVLDVSRGRKISFGFNTFTSSEDYIETVHRYHGAVHIPFNRRSVDDTVIITAVAEDYYDDTKDGIRLWAGVKLRLAAGNEPVFLIAETLTKGDNRYNLYNIGIRVPRNPSIDLIYYGDTRSAVDKFGARIWYEF